MFLEKLGLFCKVEATAGAITVSIRYMTNKNASYGI
jgi:hypothetical protein